MSKVYDEAAYKLIVESVEEMESYIYDSVVGREFEDLDENRERACYLHEEIYFWNQTNPSTKLAKLEERILDVIEIINVEMYRLSKMQPQEQADIAEIEM